MQNVEGLGPLICASQRLFASSSTGNAEEPVFTRRLQVAMDWTDFDADGQATLALKLVTRHGRATPLIWLSVLKDELSTARNDYEDACLRRLAEVLPAGVR